MNTSRRNRLVAAAAIGILSLIVVAAALVLPTRTLAQAGEFDRAQADLTQAGTPPPPPPPLHLNPATPTPEPGVLQAGAGPQTSSSDLEVIPFRPHITLRRGEAPHVATAQKAAGAAVPNDLKQSLEEMAGPQESYQAPDISSLLAPMDWVPLLSEGFEGIFPGDWILEDLSDDGYERLWGDTSYYHQVGNWSAWPAARGADALNPYTDWYTDNIDSWMEYGPLDLSNMADVFVSFGLWYDTEPEWDWVYFCASTDFVNYSCDYWSGYSNGWTDQAYWLTSYAGYSQVWLAWVFQSDASISWGLYEGPFVDEIYAWGDDLSVPPPPAATPDPAGELLQNGSFEFTNHLEHWQTYSSPTAATEAMPEIGSRAALGPDHAEKATSNLVGSTDGASAVASIGVTNTTAVEGSWSTYLWHDGVGTDWLYQVFDVPPGISDVVLDYWFAVTTYETDVNQDRFCASLRPESDLNAIWVDLGCIDSTDASGYWQEVIYTLTPGQVGQVTGQRIALMFELYNRGIIGTGTAGRVDYARVYAVGGGAGSPLDPNEPNNDAGSATAITCGQTITTGVIGDALGGYDIDWFRLNNVPAGRLDVDITARTKLPPSALDSVVGLWDNGVNLLTWKDDDGVTFDSYVVYTNTTANATFYVSVESYSGQGSADSFYDLTVQCGGSGGVPTGGTEIPPENPDDWTVMLYLNAEDANFVPILTQYRTAIESFIGGKSGFLNVVILYDGPGTNDTTRYLVQPNGNYTTGTNRWNMGELNMGDRNTLANFVTWAMDQYPSAHYYLSVDDHGDGVYGISWDPNSNNDQLTPPELYQALKSATHNGQRKIDIFDYEACLMGLAENAYDLRQWVNYVVFSEQISWGINTYPRYFSDLIAATTPLTVGQRIVDRYHAEALVADGHGYPHTISLIDTSKMVGVNNAVSNFGDALRATGNYTTTKEARNHSQAFAADMAATDYRRAEYIDLWDLADEAGARGLASAQAAAVKSAVTQAVVRERHASGGASGYVWDHSGAHGLSIYYPPSESSSAFSSYVAPTIYQMSQDGTWDEFLNWALPDPDARRGMSANRATIKLLGGDAYADKYVYLPVVLRQRN